MSVDSDPLLRAMAPPENETPAQRAVREAKEEEARLVSARIDEELRKDNRPKKTPVKVILLGQEGSGRTGFLKGFRKLYAPGAWREERLAWRTVIHLDLVRSVNKIVDALGNAPEIPQGVKLLQIRLAPLRRLQRDLEEHLGLAEGEEMRPSAVPRLVKPGQRPKLGHRDPSPGELEQAVELVIASRDDMATLWKDDGVHAFLGFIDRITERDYEPSDDDVIRVHSKGMLGVQEYHFLVETGQDAGNEWIFYDVGHSRTCRVSWLPYLTDVTAVIFRASISVFDEYLEADPQVSRLEESFRAWTTICKSNLISKVQLVLILSGCDILRDKLARGVSLRQFITSYGDRTNDQTTATKYLRDQFIAISRKNSPEQRTVRVHFTASTDWDSQVVAAVVTDVLQVVLMNNLRMAKVVS
ncbi:guanine nucleotide binding protein, alpha subunit [Russula brevipes]|nr:guanine nucleotide binding protein, alpha subunit [Russula brevipes]